MKCSDYEELLSAHASNELSHTQREFIEEHLSDCDGCRKTLAGYASVQQHLGALTDIQHKPDLKEAVMAQIRGTKTTSTTRKWLRPALVSLPVIAIMIALFIIQPWNGTNDSKGVLADIISASENVQSYRVTSYNSSSRFSQVGIEPTIREEFWEFVLPDRVHAILNHAHNSTSNGVVTRIEERTEFYIIGGSLYYLTDNDIDLSLENNSYYYSPAGGTPTQEYVSGMLQFVFELHQLPDENIDGVDLLHYEGISKRGGIPIEIWIDKDEHLVRQTMQNFEDEMGVYTHSTRYYDFNTDIAIEPPLTSAGELLPGWEVKDIGETAALIPVFEAIAAITGNEDWTNPAVILEALEMMGRVTDPLAYFNALPSEAQEVLNDFLSGDVEVEVRTTTLVESFGFNDGVLHYTNSGTGLDVVIDTGYINGENSGGITDITAIVNIWVSAIQAPDPQAYFDALPEETQKAMASSLSDGSVSKLVTDALD